MTLPDWVPGRTLYQLHSIEAAAGGGLRRLTAWLDHVAELGWGGVLLTPVAASSSHGYDTVDPFRLDPRLGTDADFGAFVDECHRRDLRLVLDGVFNHVGRGFGPFLDVLAHRAASDFASWFRLDFSGDDGDGFAYRSFEGHGELVALDHRTEAVLDWAADVATTWLDRGADGWRFDAAYAIPLDFLAALTGRIRGRHPDAFLFGEVIHGDYAGFVAGSGLDSVTQYELHKATWSALNDANLFELAWALERHRAFSTEFAPVTFVGNHDVTRLASRLHEPRHIGHALAVLFTVPGVPCVYYGDELAWRGVKEERAGGDDAIRPPLPDDASPADDEQSWVLELHRELIALRRARPWLTTATLEVVDRANRQLTFTVAGPAGALRVRLDVDGGRTPAPEGWRTLIDHAGVVIVERA